MERGFSARVSEYRGLRRVDLDSLLADWREVTHMQLVSSPFFSRWMYLHRALGCVPNWLFSTYSVMLLEYLVVVLILKYISIEPVNARIGLQSE